MESSMQFKKRKAKQGRKGRGQELSGEESPKMPQIGEKWSRQFPLQGKGLNSPKEKPETFSVKLPQIGHCHSEVDPHNNEHRKFSCRHSNYHEIPKCHSNSSNLNKQNSWSSNFSLCSQQSSESPCHQQKQHSNKGKEQHLSMLDYENFSIMKQNLLQSSAGEDPILRDLYSSIQAEKEIREILNRKKKAQVFKPPVLFNNYQRKQQIGQSIQKPLIDNSRFSPPQRLLVNPIIKDKRFQMMHQESPSQSSYLERALHNMRPQMPTIEEKTMFSDQEDNFFNTSTSKASTTISNMTQEQQPIVQNETKILQATNSTLVDGSEASAAKENGGQNEAKVKCGALQQLQAQ